MNFDLNELIEKAKKKVLLNEIEIKQICQKAKEIFSKEENIISISSPITVVGDIHGQFQDLIELFYQGGYPPDTNYLFIGDYVDRGLNSIETITLLLLLKIQSPHNIFLTRGNHESRYITQLYGFYDECLRKFGSTFTWRNLNEVFDTLPLAAIINDKIYCLHGGLSPTALTLDEMRKLDRFSDIPKDGPFCDMLWSDPEDRNGWGISPRGAGFVWGSDCSEEFLFLNKINFISRAHQLVMKGYNWCHNQKVLSLFSAPNYCYRCGNEAAIMELEDENNFEFIQYFAAPETEYMDEEKKLNDEYFHIKYSMRYFS